MIKKTLTAIIAAATLFGFNTNTFAFSLDAVFFGNIFIESYDLKRIDQLDITTVKGANDIFGRGSDRSGGYAITGPTGSM